MSLHVDGQSFLEAAREEPFRRRQEVLVEVLSTMVGADNLMLRGRVVAPLVAHEANETLKAVAELLFTGLLEESPAATRNALLAIPLAVRPHRIDFDAWLERAPAEAEVVPIGPVTIASVEAYFRLRLPSQLRLEWSHALRSSDSMPFRSGSFTDLVREAQALGRWLEQLGAFDDDEHEDAELGEGAGRPRVLPFADVVDEETGNRDVAVLDLGRPSGDGDFRVLIVSLETDSLGEFATSQLFLKPQRSGPARASVPVELREMTPAHERPLTLEERCRQVLKGSSSSDSLARECLEVAQSQLGEQVVVALECLVRLGAGSLVLDRDSLVLRAGPPFVREVDRLLTRLRTP